MGPPGMDKTLLEKMVDTFHAAQVSQARIAFGEALVDLRGARDFFREVDAESDTGLAIITASYIEAVLSDCIKKGLPQLSAAAERDIFENDGPLATFSAKIKLTHALGWTSETTGHDLNLLRRIRNICAHDPFKRSLSDKPLCDLIASMRQTEQPLMKFRHSEDGETKPPLSVRDRFRIRAALTFYRAAGELTASPVAAKYGVSARSVIGRVDEVSDDGMENYKEAWRDCMRFVAGIAGIEFEEH